MSNLHRIQWIDAMIRAGRYPNCRRIAEKFEISTRQASRDIEYLRDSLAAPIVYSARQNGYYYSNEAFVLPALLVSEEERRALAYLAEQYAGLRGEMAGRLADIFSRLSGPIHTGRLAGPRLLALELRMEEIEAYQVLRQAIDGRCAVRLVYLDPSGARTERTFCPYKLFPRDGLYYVVGYCQLRGDLRVFRLDRIVEVTCTDEIFEVVPFYDEHAYGQEIPFHFGDAYVATIRISNPADARKLRFRLVDRTGDVYRLQFHRSEDLISQLLAISPAFAILHPRWLRERLLARLDQIRMQNLRLCTE